MSVSRSMVNILVIDDVNAIRIQVASLLSSLGLTSVTMVDSAISAMAILKKSTFHLILCDWHMSGLDGLDVVKFLKESSPPIESLIVMVTADATKECVMQAVSAGVNGYIVKPLTTEAIQAKLLTLLKDKKVID